MEESFALQLKNVSKRDKVGYILKDISLSVFPGEFLGIYGSSSSGKTSLLRVIGGLYKPTNGTIKIFDFNMEKQLIHAISAIDGYINEPKFYPHFTGYENLELTFTALGKKNSGMLTKLIELFELEDFIHKKNKYYSHYEKQILVLAQSLISQPKILILDTPFNGMKKEEQQKYINFLKLLSTEQGMTIIVTTLNFLLLVDICDRIVVLENGEIVNEFAYTKEQNHDYYRYMIEVNAPSLATYIIETHFPLLQGLIREYASCITIVSNKKTVPKIIEFLSKNGVEVYEFTKLEELNPFMQTKLLKEENK